MTEEDRQKAIEDHIVWCNAERAQAADTLQHIAEGWTFHEARGQEQLRDVTTERADHQRRIIEKMNRIIAAYGRRNA